MQNKKTENNLKELFAQQANNGSKRGPQNPNKNRAIMTGQGCSKRYL